MKVWGMSPDLLKHAHSITSVYIGYVVFVNSLQVWREASFIVAIIYSSNWENPRSILTMGLGLVLLMTIDLP